MVFVIIGVILFASGFWLGKYYYDKNKTQELTYNSSKPYYGDIELNTMATGTIVPRKEINVKSAVSGIVDKMYVGTGSIVKKGDLLAKIKIIPNAENLNRAQSAVETAKINLSNSENEFFRIKDLFEKEIIPDKEFDQIKFDYQLKKQLLVEAKDNLLVVKNGAKTNSKQVTNMVRATMGGTILKLGVLVGDNVIESNSFSEGTTIVSIADMNDMIFSGTVDESEVGKLKEGMPIELTIGAYDDKTFNGILEFISPQGEDVEGTVKFSINASFEYPDSFELRSGFSANSEVLLDKKNDVLIINESEVVFRNDSTFVEVEISEQKFEKRLVKTGLSNGLQIEIISGLDTTNNIKIQNSGKEEGFDY